MKVLPVLGFISCFAVPALIQATQADARSVLERFCEMDAEGKQLTEDGWKEVSAMFSSPGPQPQAQFLVIRDFVVSEPKVNGSKEEFYVEYVMLGRIDPQSARFSSLPPVKVRAGFDLIPASKPTNASAPTFKWKIQGGVPEPHLSLAAAIEFVTGLRSRTTLETVKKNANKTIASLRQFDVR